MDWEDHRTLFAATDHLGHTRVLFDGTGHNEVLDFAPFGEQNVGPEPPGTTHLFTGHERDGATTSSELDYMHARYYSSDLGRFLSVDPVGGSVGSSQSWNRYSYVRNNPLKFIDPTGERNAIIYGQEQDVEPGDLAVLKYDQGTQVHVAMVADFVQVDGEDVPRALVVENGPQDANPNLRLGHTDSASHTPSPVDSNSSEAGSGIWNAQNGYSLDHVVTNTKTDGSPFTTGDVLGARGAVGAVTYTNTERGAMQCTTDCAGYVNQLVSHLGGTAKSRVFAVGPWKIENNKIGFPKAVNQW